MKERTIIKLLFLLILIINFTIFVSNIYVFTLLTVLILLILFLGLIFNKLLIPASIMLIILGINHLFVIIFLGSKPYIANSDLLSLLIPIIELVTAYLILKPNLKFLKNDKKSV